jgi:SAM-dependent methyltransferase
LKIQCDASPDQLTQLTKRIAEEWFALGATKPHFSVLTDPSFLPDKLGVAEARFWTTGEGALRKISAMLSRHDFGDSKAKIAADYGCGIGRVTVPLSTIFREIHAYDISEPHLRMAMDHAESAGAKNITFHQVRNVLEGLQPCDFFYSRIVFQHNPPPIIRELVRNALRCLRPGGLAIFQVPVYARNYSFSIDKYLNSPKSASFEMHCLPQHEIFSIVHSEGCHVREVREDSAIRNPNWLSNMFFVRR